MFVTPVSTSTGVRLAGRFEPESASYSSELGSLGSGTFSIPGSEFGEGELERLTAGQDVTWVFSDRSGAALFAGFVVDADWDGFRVSVNVAELGHLAEKRFLQPVYEGRRDVQFQASSLDGLLVAALRAGLSGLPVEFPAVSGTGKSVTFHWWRFLTIREIVDELQAEDDAPVLQFVPEWRDDGRFWWRLRLRVIDSVVHAVSAGTPGQLNDGRAVVTVKRDFKAHLTELYVIGNGQESKTVWGCAGAREVPSLAGSLLLQGKSSWGTVESVARANVLAKGLLAARRDSVEQWQVTVNNEAGDRFMPGQRVLVRHPGDAFVRQGSYERTIIGVEADAGMVVRLLVQEVATQADRAQSGLAGVLRRLAAAETQASNRASTTIDDIRSLTDRAQRAADASQARADAAAKAAADARARADAANRAAATAQSSANSARSAAGVARARADAAHSYAGSAAYAASGARSAASVAQSAAGVAQGAANRANTRVDHLKVWVTKANENAMYLDTSGQMGRVRRALFSITEAFRGV